MSSNGGHDTWDHSHNISLWMRISDKMTLEHWLVPSIGPEGGIQDIVRTQDNSGEGNGTPLQYSCLEDPMDGGTW